MMMVPTEGIKGKESIVLQIAKKLKENNLVVKTWTRDDIDCMLATEKHGTNTWKNARVQWSQ